MVDEDSEVMAPSPHRALIAEDSEHSSDPEEVYLALAQKPEARNAGRAVPTRLPTRKRGSLAGKGPGTSSAAPEPPLAAQASLSELNSMMMQDSQKQEEEEIAELARMPTRPARVRGRKPPLAKASSSPRKSPRDSDSSDSSSLRDELSDRSVSSASGLGNITLSDKASCASRVRI